MFFKGTFIVRLANISGQGEKVRTRTCAEGTIICFAVALSAFGYEIGSSETFTLIGIK